MRKLAWIAIAACACTSGPILQNAPRPNAAVVAGAAAAVAGAATLADPQAAAKRQEAKDQREVNNDGVEVKQTVPADVLDRLDQAQAGQAGGSAAPRAPGLDAGVDAAPAPRP